MAIGYNGQFVAIYPDHDAVFVIQSDDTTSDASSWDLLGEVPSVIAGLPPAPTPAPSTPTPSAPTRRPTSAPAGGSSGSASGASDEVLDGASIGLLVGVVFLAAAVAGGAFYYRLSKRAVPRPGPVVELATAAFCAQCGAARAGGANFCSSCGAPFVDERLPP